MKKILLMMFVLLVSGTLLAQGTVQKKAAKSFFALHGGPSFPVDDFNSRDLNNENAGFAKTGYTIDLSYAYLFDKNAGVTASVFFNNYKADKILYSFADPETGLDVPLTLDHWKFWGVTAGPMLTVDLGKGIMTDFKIMGGLVNANGPDVSYQGIVMSKGSWKTTSVFQGGLNLRIGINNNIFFLTSADYMYLKPKFKYQYTDENDQTQIVTIRQRMSAVNVSAGIGIKF